MRIERSALVTHSAMDMYALVLDVASYPEFLSWCTATTVHEQDEASQKASLTVTVAGITQRFTTLNTLREGQSLGMHLHEGPFRNLHGEWLFTQLGEDGCRISLELDFEMAAGVMSKMFGKGFGKIANRLVEDFCRRAEDVYEQ